MNSLLSGLFGKKSKTRRRKSTGKKSRSKRNISSKKKSMKRGKVMRGG